MSRIGLIGGTALKDWDEFEIEEKIEKNTPWGTPSSPLFKGEMGGKEIILLMRHGRDHTIPPHRINHRANVYALQEEVDGIIGICSSGALNVDVEVPSISIPKDYVNFWNPMSFYNEKIKHVTPELSQTLRNELIEAAEEAAHDYVDLEYVYVQTEGPRLETKAEVKILQEFGDLVGMTMASEATLSNEISLEYAALVTVDNYAHGIKDEKVDYEDIVDTASDNWDNVKDILVSFL
ncbi:MAG: MTAP family purine nucleoside phosphorylase, partial [Candidatus Thermoplasmatota archaeon]|nr:MTAP family purine nucleoside phosphorylase [Candidatus Thermoplasmatota archaeon]